MAKNKAVTVEDDEDDQPVTTGGKTPKVTVQPDEETKETSDADDPAPSRAAAKTTKDKAEKDKGPNKDTATKVRIQCLRTLEPAPRIGDYNAVDAGHAKFIEKAVYVVPDYVGAELESKGLALVIA